MELVFFYINQTESRFVEKKGFNFSPNYHFNVEYIDGKYILEQTKSNTILPNDFFDKEGCITNITAIVGENGAGKTTLLNEISSYCGSVKEQEGSEEYKSFYDEKYENEKSIVIYLEESELVCYHNIDNFENKTNVKIHYLKQGSIELMNIAKNSEAFENISKICLSNSMYAVEQEIFTYQSINKIMLNVNSIRNLKDIFFRKKCRKIGNCVGGYYELQDIICEAKRLVDFQHILDILYLQDIRENNIKSVLGKEIIGTLKIRFSTVEKYIEKRYRNIIKDKKNESVFAKYYRVKEKRYLSKLGTKLKKTDVFVVMYSNLLYELIAYLRMEDDEKGEVHTIESKKELVECIDQMINKISKDLIASDFKNAFKEIQEYEKVLANCKNNFCSLPVNDLGYISYIQIKNSESEFEKFLNLIKKSVFERKYSYVLKYIEIEGIQLASGERALLNFFSWMHFVPYFNYISNNVKESLYDNVLLLIDEIDLYCHPLWQQKLLKYLIEEIKIQYKGKKVQIIFTTHSPIVLSDMPRSNVIFLKRKNGKCSVDEDDRHGETFGANIYNLFNDAFFLGEKGQIGEFAKEKIQSIINEIRPEVIEEGVLVYPSLSNEEISSLEHQIMLIGEKIIRDKLYDMLYKCKNKYNSLNLREKKIAIYKERIRRLENGEDL